MSGFSKIHGIAKTRAAEFAAFLEHTFGLTIDTVQHKQLTDEFDRHVAEAVQESHTPAASPDSGAASEPEEGADGQSKPAPALEELDTPMGAVVAIDEPRAWTDAEIAAHDRAQARAEQAREDRAEDKAASEG